MLLFFFLVVCVFDMVFFMGSLWYGSTEVVWCFMVVLYRLVDPLLTAEQTWTKRLLERETG